MLHVQAVPGNYHMPNKWLLLGWILFLKKVAFYLASRKVLQGVTQKAEEEHGGSFQT